MVQERMTQLCTNLLVSCLAILRIVGQDYSNPRIKDFENGTCVVSVNQRLFNHDTDAVVSTVSQWDKVLIDKQRLARMPWHDVSVGVVRNEPLRWL